MTTKRRSNRRVPAPAQQLAIPGFGIVAFVALERYGNFLRWTLKNARNGDPIGEPLKATVDAPPDALLVEARARLQGTRVERIWLAASPGVICYALSRGDGL